MKTFNAIRLPPYCIDNYGYSTSNNYDCGNGTGSGFRYGHSSGYGAGYGYSYGYSYGDGAGYYKYPEVLL